MFGILESLYNKFNKVDIRYKIIMTLFLWPFLLIYLYVRTKESDKRNMLATKITLSTLGIFLIIGIGSSVSALIGSSLQRNESQVAGVSESKSSSSQSSKNTVTSSSSSNNDQKVKELEKLVAEATYINADIPEEQDDQPQNNVEEVKQANIAYTRDTKDSRQLVDVLSVVDGDTLVLSSVKTVRLIGVDTPETKDPRKVVQCFGKEASAFAKTEMLGKKVYLEFDSTQGRIDKYGRTLAYVYREDGFFLNKELIAQGYANEYTFKTPYKYQDEFKAASVQAKNSGAGLWASNTCNGDATKAADEPKPPVTVQPQPTTSYSSSKSQATTYVAPKPSLKFKNCTEAKAAGYANMTRGDGVYELNTGLDRDKDGIACDK